MNIAIIGSGGREHSICYKLSKSKKINKIYCIPGNAGTKNLSTNINLDISNFKEIYENIKGKEIDLIIVGPEVPLVNGIVDYFQKKKIKIFGPSKNASKLEGSKIFMKTFCKKFNIPAGTFKEIKSLKYAKKYVKNIKLPIVVKSDGLAAGKGVTICNSREEAIKNIRQILSGKFNTSSKVFIEEYLEGDELSYFIITDGKDFKCFGTAQDHKRIGEGEKGLNTGGMGAYSPSQIINKSLEKKIINKIIKPTIIGMSKIGYKYSGILYAGIIVKNNEPKLIEYNIRFGDPECQVLMMRLKNDLIKLILATFNKKLKNAKIKWSKNPGITIVAANKGYPKKFKKNTEIKGLKNFLGDKNKQLFHAGTTINENGKFIATGGRVLNSTVVSKSLKKAREEALLILDKLKWKNKYYRRDIGFKVIRK